jgi:hypothetical protein
MFVSTRVAHAKHISNPTSFSVHKLKLHNAKISQLFPPELQLSTADTTAPHHRPLQHKKWPPNNPQGKAKKPGERMSTSAKSTQGSTSSAMK